MPESKEIKSSQETMSTLSAQFAGKYMNKIVNAVRDLRRKGTSETRILEKMKDELRQVDDHTMRRIYDKSLGRSIPDDITDDLVADVRESKPGKIEMTLNELPWPISLGTIIQYHGEDYCVTVQNGLTFTLKKIA